MRLDKLWIGNFRNINNLTILFDQDRLTTVLIGQNGSGKSNLIEAIVEIFQKVDLGKSAPNFDFRLEYHINDYKIIIENKNQELAFYVNDKRSSKEEFRRHSRDFMPDTIFGFYSGTNNRLEKLFETHQKAYYDKIIKDDFERLKTLSDRKLFYCRQIHGVISLLGFFSVEDETAASLLKKHLGISTFKSALITFKRPWFANKNTKLVGKVFDFWGASGYPKETANHLQNMAFFPITTIKRVQDDYRGKGNIEQQHFAYLRNNQCLKRLKDIFSHDLDMFEALESLDISDLIRTIRVWLIREIDNQNVEIEFDDMSDGERQLLMVMGLLRLSRGRNSLFLLDEPETHLNPAWQYEYIKMINEFVGENSNRCHVILSSHNPLTISPLEARDVRIMFKDEKGNTRAEPPYTDPKGLGFTSTLTEIFGLQSSVDTNTQDMIDDRNLLLKIDARNEEQDIKLADLNQKLDRLGFLFESREPLYNDFLKALQDVTYADKPLLTPEQIRDKNSLMKTVLKELMAKQGGVN